MLTLVVGLLSSFFISAVYAENTPLFTDRMYLTAGDQIIETDELRQFYELGQGKWHWVQDGRLTEKALQLREVLISAENEGLDKNIYWTPLHERLFSQINPTRARTFEILASDALLRFAQDVSRGQVLDPDLIDEDIKMTRKAESLLPRLSELLKTNQNLIEALSSLAPQHSHYQSLKKILHRLLDLQKRKAWGELKIPGREIKPGQSHVSLVEVKKRLQDLGYGKLNETEIFDPELERAAQTFRKLNGLSLKKNLNAQFFQALDKSLDERILQVRANLEKMRWFPNVWEPTYLFVNLAFQEAKVTQAGSVILKMQTVNGRPTRRTPTLRDEIRFLEPSPTWTVPFSIAVKDKLDQLKNDPKSLLRQNIWVHDQNRNVIDPTAIDWNYIDRTNFRYILIQQPGPQNSLGLVKFPLQNPWFIYLHDTNEPHLMKEVNRLRSSGCVRLEKPWELVSFLMQDQPEWSKAKLLQSRYSAQAIFVKQKLPVYFSYLTVEEGESGEIRFAEDRYGQDQRLIELFKTRGSLEKF